MHWDFTESPSYSSQILKADLDDMKFPWGPTLLQHVDDLLCSPPQAFSQEDSTHFLELFALKKHQVTKEKLEFAQIQDWPLSSTANQSLRSQTLGNRLSDSHLKKALNPEWTSTLPGDLKVNISRIEADIWWDTFPKIPSLLEVCCQTFDDDLMLQMISNVYDLNMDFKKGALELSLPPWLATHMWPQ